MKKANYVGSIWFLHRFHFFLHFNSCESWNSCFDSYCQFMNSLQVIVIQFVSTVMSSVGRSEFVLHMHTINTPLAIHCICVKRFRVSCLSHLRRSNNWRQSKLNTYARIQRTMTHTSLAPHMHSTPCEHRQNDTRTPYDGPNRIQIHTREHADICEHWVRLRASERDGYCSRRGGRHAFCLRWHLRLNSENTK